MSEATKVLLAERDKLRDQLTRIDRALAILNEDEQPAAPAAAERRPRRRKQKRAADNRPSKGTLEHVLSFINDTEGRVRSKQVANALGVSQSTAGKALKALAADGAITYDGTLKDLIAQGVQGLQPEKGTIALYSRKNHDTPTVEAPQFTEGEAVPLVPA